MGQYMCRLNVSMRSQVNGVYFFLKHVNCGMYKIWQRDLHVVTFAYTLLYSWPLLCSFTYLFLTSIFCEYRIKGVSFMCQNFYTDDMNEWVNKTWCVTRTKNDSCQVTSSNMTTFHLFCQEHVIYLIDMCYLSCKIFDLFCFV